MTGGRRDALLTHQDLDDTRVGSKLPFGPGVEIVKQPGGQWRRIDGHGNPIGSVMSASTAASYGFKRHELRAAPDGGR